MVLDFSRSPPGSIGSGKDHVGEKMFRWSCLGIAEEWEELFAPVRGRKQVHVFIQPTSSDSSSAELEAIPALEK